MKLQNKRTESDFFAGLGRQIEHEHAEERDENGRQDQVDGVEECLAPDDDVERDVRFGWYFLVDVEERRDVDDVPGTALPVIRQIDEILVVVEGEGYLVAIERPRAEFHDAGLLIEREVRDVDRAGALVDGRWDPEHLAVRVDQDVGFVAHLVVTVGAGEGKDVVNYLLFIIFFSGRMCV